MPETSCPDPQSKANTVMSKARAAAPMWAALSVQERLFTIKRWQQQLIAHLDLFVDVMRRECRKTHMDALMGDLYPTLDAILYYRRRARRMLAPKRVSTPLFFFGSRSYVTRHPLGVVSVFAPWNFPIQLAVIPMVSALIAGNTVILKPSEKLSAVSKLLAQTIVEAGFPEGVCQVLEGGPEVGAALVNAKPDKVFFTGSQKVGQLILKQAAQHMIPCDLELSGKDPLIVCADAHLRRAARAAVWGSFFNTGQVCVSVERVYVHERVYQPFTRLVVEETARLRQSLETFADIGGMTTQEGFHTCVSHLQDALAKGATVLTGGLPDQGEDALFAPTVLTNVTADMRLMQDETFGPLLPIIPFASEQEAIDLANATPYGLSASIFSRDVQRALRMAAQLETGNCYINDVVRNIANIRLPFGGVKASGQARYHGVQGLHAFTTTKSIMVDSGRRSFAPHYFPYKESTYRGLRTFVRLFYRS